MLFYIVYYGKDKLEFILFFIIIIKNYLVCIKIIWDWIERVKGIGSYLVAINNTNKNKN